MGMFKQLKDMKNVVEQAPGMIEQAQQLGAQAQEMAAAQQAAAASAAAAGAATGPDFEPVNGVSIEQYAEISKELADSPGDEGRAMQAAAARGISPDDWQAAVAGWNQRMQTNPAVGQRFNALYTGR